MKRFRFFEPALAIGLALTLIVGAAAQGTQQRLAEKLVRLHIVANSDSAEDQALKLCVRDRVLSAVQELSPENPAEARREIEAALPELERTAREEILLRGYDYPVKVHLCNMYFGTREYDTFSLPAGYYDACRIEIGAAEGRNWWCVMFPPLCLSAAEFESAADMAGLSEEERALIESGKPVYRAKFKAIEWFSKIRHFFS